MKASGTLWMTLCVVLATGAVVGWFSPTSALSWQPGRAGAEPWRWWSAAFVHWSGLHLAANLAALAVVAAIGRVARLPAVITLAWLASWPLTHLALLLRPDLAHYGGLSGVLHAGVAVAALYLALTQPGRRRWIGRAMLAGLAFKVLLEAPWGPVLQPGAGWDIAVAPLAHASGAVMGLLCAFTALARERRGAR